MGLSGLGDHFSSLMDLSCCMPPWLTLPEGVASVLQLQDWNGQPLLLNAYVLDYYKHQQRAALVREGDAWEKLRSVCGILAALDSALSDVVVAEEPPGGGEREGWNDAGAAAGGGGGGVTGASARSVSSSSKHVAEVFHQVHLSFKQRFAVFNGSKESRQRRK
jgi:hypothetical protein